MNAKNILRQLIREELKAALREAILAENAVQLDERRKMSKGQNWSKKKDRATFTSAGTVPNSSKNPERKVDSSERDAKGRKNLNLYARGNVRGTGSKKNTKSSEAARFRKSVNKYAAKKFGGSPSRKQINSAIWAITSHQLAMKNSKKAKSAKPADTTSSGE